MAILVHKLFKVALFIGLCLLSIRYIPLSNEWTLAETRAWFAAADLLGVDDVDNLYYPVWLTIDLIVATLAYGTIMRLWLRYQGGKAAQQDGSLEGSSGMAAFARRLCKVVLFCGLFRLLLPYVHPYPVQWTESQSLEWSHAANRLGIHDPEDLFFWVAVTMNLIATALAHVALMKLWRHYRRNKATLRNSN